MDKDFDKWNKKKKALDSMVKLPFFSEGQVWWCSVGLNVGYEILGKDALFSRPVLIMRKYSKSTFFGLPMTSKRKDYPLHYHFDFQGEKGSIILDQGRVFDARRLADKMGEVPQQALQEIRQAFKNSH